MPNASWHFSYFSTTERYRAKMFAANVAEDKWGSSVTKGERMQFSDFVDLVVQCKFPWKVSWRTAMRIKVPTDVPSYVLRNPCRMRAFFAHANVPGGNDWYLLRDGANAAPPRRVRGLRARKNASAATVIRATATDAAGGASSSFDKPRARGHRAKKNLTAPMIASIAAADARATPKASQKTRGHDQKKRSAGFLAFG